MSEIIEDYSKNKILLNKKFPVNKLQIINNQISNRKTNPEIEKKIKENWLKYYPKSTEIDIWNSSCYRLNEFCIQDDELFLEISTIKYKEHVGLKSISQINNLEETYYSKALSIEGIIQTSDNKFIFISNVETKQFDLIEVNLLKEKFDISSGFDLCEIYLDEINKQLGISQFYVKNSLFCGIVLVNKSNIKLILEIKLNINSTTVEKLFESKNDKEKIVFIDEQNLNNFAELNLNIQQKLIYDLI